MDIILTLFKLNIGVSSKVKDELFLAKIEAIIGELASIGVNIDESVNVDRMLVADLAAWEYLKASKNEPMPCNISERIDRRKTRARCGDA